MRAVFLNNLRRLWTQKQLLVVLVVLTIAATSAAVFISAGFEQTLNVAVVSDQAFSMETDHINFIQLGQAPRQSDLITGRYDAIITFNTDGGFDIDSIKNEATTSLLAAALEGQPIEESFYSDRGTGTNIFGFIMMFILLSGFMAMSMYADDKEKGQIYRIAASPVGMGRYLLANSLFDFCFLFFPITVILLLARQISGLTFGYTIWELVILVALLCTFATVLCLFLYTYISNKDDAAKNIGNSIIILTSILAGCFYAFDKGNPALEFIIKVLPQKAFLTLADGLEQGASAISFLPSLAYLFGFILILGVLSVVKVKRDYINKR